MTKVHIKFLDHGKGSAAHASAYVLDTLDHLGNIRAGVEVLRGDATTFNAICDSSPHLWKYTSGVIAWSKEDDPTSEQIKTVLDEFEQHAFAGLDPSQYHLFAVLHTDQDGSKHIHVLAPRLDMQSGKSLNIAPPGHEKHFDSLRDYFNTKYQWSRPDDLLLMQTTQEPNHVTKLNAQARNILTGQDLETLTKKQFCKTIDNYVQTLLKTQAAENRADIVECIEQLNGVESVKPSKAFLTVTLSNGKKHRLKGDFYHEDFEIKSYSEHLRAAAESRTTASELTQAIRDADELRVDYRAKRKAYNEKHHTATTDRTDDNSHRIASKLDIDRGQGFITTSIKRDDSELPSANRCTHNTVIEYRYIRSGDSPTEHRFVFGITSRPPNDHKPPVTGHQDRPNESTKIHSNPNRASDSKPKRADSGKIPESFGQQLEQSESHPRRLGDDDSWSVHSFNQFLFRLSNTNPTKNHRGTKTNHSAELTSDHEPNQLFEQPTEIEHAVRNRPILSRAKQLIESTKQLIDRTKCLIEPTGGVIKEHIEQLQRSGTELKEQSHDFAVGDRSPSNFDIGTQRRAIQNRAGQFFAGFTANISGQLVHPIGNAINSSLKASEFRENYQKFSGNRVVTDHQDDYHTAERPTASTLEALTIQSINQYRRRLADSGQAAHGARNNAWQLNSIDLKVKQLTDLIENIRIKPKFAFDLKLRNDGYYPDYVLCHERLSKQQDAAYKSKNLLDVISCIAEKSDNLKQYTSRAWQNLSNYDYDKVEKIIKNDEIMLKHLQCEVILEKQNDRFRSQRQDYEKCLATFDRLKQMISEKRNPSIKNTDSQQRHEPENKPRPNRDFDFY